MGPVHQCDVSQLCPVCLNCSILFYCGPCVRTLRTQDGASTLVEGRTRRRQLEKKCLGLATQVAIRYTAQPSPSIAIQEKLTYSRQKVEMLRRIIALRRGRCEEMQQSLKEKASSTRNSKARYDKLLKFLAKVAKERTYRRQRNDAYRDKVVEQSALLIKVRHRLARSCLTYVFPINVIKHEALLAASVMTSPAVPSHLERVLADAAAMTFMAGQWRVDDGSVGSAVPSNLAASISFILIGQCRFTDRPEPYDSPEVVASLAYMARLLRLIAALYDIVLPYRVTYASFCNMPAGPGGESRFSTLPFFRGGDRGATHTVGDMVSGLLHGDHRSGSSPTPQTTAPSQSSSKSTFVALAAKLYANLGFLASALCPDHIQTVRLSTPMHNFCILLNFINNSPRELLDAAKRTRDPGNLTPSKTAGKANHAIISSAFQADFDSLKNLDIKDDDQSEEAFYELSPSPEREEDSGPFTTVKFNSMGKSVYYDSENRLDGNPNGTEWESLEEGHCVPEYCPPHRSNAPRPRLSSSVSTFLRSLADLSLND